MVATASGFLAVGHAARKIGVVALPMFAEMPGKTIMQDWRDEKTHAGLCADCIHAKKITSERGSVFIFCLLSQTDPRFAKYPRLPVLECPGYEPTPGGNRERPPIADR